MIWCDIGINKLHLATSQQYQQPALKWAYKPWFDQILIESERNHSFTVLMGVTYTIAIELLNAEKQASKHS